MRGERERNKFARNEDPNQIRRSGEANKFLEEGRGGEFTFCADLCDFLLSVIPSSINDSNLINYLYIKIHIYTLSEPFKLK
jgi:hypothetical protein